MKKIVALVLSLVMVLGLATVAMAATAGPDLDAALAEVATTAEVKAAVPAAPSVKAFGTYQIYVTNTETKAVAVEGPYAELVSDNGAEMVYVNGNTIRYFATAQTYELELKAVKVEYRPAALVKCGDVYVDDKANAGTYFYDAKTDTYYADGGSTVANVGGKMALVDVATTVIVAEHNYNVDTKTVAGETSVAAVNCVVCQKSFAFVEGTVADAVAKFGAGKFVEVEQGLYAAKAAGAAAAEGDKVESAETFDAGIAMYVGMSVMAAAGSAVVLKKKD